jgi:hypothetical protein
LLAENDADHGVSAGRHHSDPGSAGVHWRIHDAQDQNPHVLGNRTASRALFAIMGRSRSDETWLAWSNWALAVVILGALLTIGATLNDIW